MDAILVTGPARSGKSEWAEYLAIQTGKTVTYVATAEIDPGDREWHERIAQHCQRRPADWQILEIPRELTATIRASEPSSCLLVDSLGTWVANLLSEEDSTWEKTYLDLFASLETGAGTIIFVAEETGWGVVPAYASGRKFRDRLGRLVRELGVRAESVYLVTGGMVLNLSSLGRPLPTQPPTRS
ncbi:bifunctional adenosylcobinamide kinase/adenosylcobinamide-phosphate guanylyltransferase [Oscillatoria salina]|uniref:bifunctional adenosylcobinamide kinase/adenosylcobinamide-phosphate guanylyltransferase n=1 Tax=Oscillatoria salina TaxID=331517 RepID=UPI0013B9B27F|nr:bifunctional adenosylcobinamide kinase/adenosylcobinamide-phosphate guanylyltransferase [Oscillatoria salina]MBZ8181260.1 bifunctional adenosylcobinamide kinase/adenosylcobinamide-phosphate guanylyltransferase [Oscillatoria salina IIICB1]NET90410.1 bifunctional adenosylcobinamide kinase/adenosylcobinamide-phosphate guanylyltransferase [Kamptonema sp. SIO1D9]